MDNVQAYVHTYFSAVHGDFNLLQQMNQLALTKYSEMTETATEVEGQVATVFEKYKQFAPFLQQIDQMDVSLSHLEAAARSLDEYTRRLELRFRKL